MAVMDKFRSKYKGPHSSGDSGLDHVGLLGCFWMMLAPDLRVWSIFRDLEWKRSNLSEFTLVDRQSHAEYIFRVCRAARYFCGS
eukprot:COSAG01_NODE_8290_length_2841_cov_2.408826_2_plen_84_part_00